jgi:hypothetical protein
MQWTLRGDFSASNHAPVVVLNDTCGPGAFEASFNLGDSIVVDASKSWDPDGDELSFEWFHYREVTERMQEGYIPPVSLDIKVTKLDAGGGLVSIEPLKNSVRMSSVLSVGKGELIIFLTDYAHHLIRR